MSIAYNTSIVGAKSDDLILHLDAGSKVSIPNRTENTAQEWVDLSKYTTSGAPQYDAIIPHTPDLPSGHAYPPFSNAFGGCLLYSNVTKLQLRLKDSYYFNEWQHLKYTISIWFQTASSFNANDDSSRGLITTGDNANSFHFYHVHNASFDRLYVGAHSSYGGSPTGSYYDIEPSTWYNATLVLDTAQSQDYTVMQSNALKIYVNGDLIGNHSFTRMGANAADLFYIGGGGSSNLNANDELYGYDDHSKLLYSYLSTGSKHVGAISSVLMYQRALTELEVKQNFNALRGRYSSYSSGGGSSIVTENLVLNLDAGNNSSYGGSGTTWTDLSGQNNNGTINGATYNSGDGGYFIFDGTNDRVSLPAGSDFAYGTGDFTIESWFNVTGTSPQTWGEIAFSQTVSGTNYFIAYISSGNPVLKKPTFTYGTGGGTPIVSSTAYTEDTWYHYVVTRNGTTLTMYLNNSVVATDTVSFNFNNTTYVPTIGAYTHSDNHNLDGKISIVRVYKGKGFSASDVTQNYFAVKSRYGY